MIKVIYLLFFLFISICNAYTVEVKNIEIIGNDKISTETIKVFSKIKIGQDINENNLNIILKDLYSTNFFDFIYYRFSQSRLTTRVFDILENETNKIMRN